MAERGGLEEKLDCMCGGVAGGAQIGSGAKWIGEGERNTGFFLGLEGRHRAGNAVLEMGAGSRALASGGGIVEEMCHFCGNLYTSESIGDVDMGGCLDDVGCPGLGNGGKECCDSLSAVGECADAVNDLENGRSPGLDGVPAEFYKCFWENGWTTLLRSFIRYFR